MGSLDTQFFPSPALQPWACSLSCSWGSQAAVHISGSAALAECLASPSLGLSQVSTVQSVGWGMVQAWPTAWMSTAQFSVETGQMD